MKQQIEWIRGAIAAVLGLIALIMIVSTLLGAMESPPELSYPGPYPEPYPARDAYPAYLPVAPSAPTVEPSYP